MTSLASVQVRTVIRASSERVFEAWVSPEQFRRWWGPEGVSCIEASLDVRVGGQYRIGNQTPNGEVIWIEGRFQEISAPERLVFTWNEVGSPREELVTVTFRTCDEGCEVTVVHELIDTPEASLSRRAGWNGCLAGLERFVDDRA